MLANEVNDLLTSKKLLTEIYFDLQTLFETKYGKNALVIMEIGTFFEVYEVDNDDEKLGKAKEIAELLNIQLTRKNKSIINNDRKNPLLAGVPAISIEKHLNKIINEQNYTIALIRQRGVPPNVSRYLDTVVSPGINFDFAINNDENNVTSISIDMNNERYSIGISGIDVTTGKSYYNEVNSTKEDSSFALDEAFNYMSIHKTSEVILTFLDKNINQSEVINYLELSNLTYHINIFRPKISYQNELFKSVYKIESLLTPIEHLDMEKTPLASESLAILIDFIINHDSSIVQKLSEPFKLDTGKFVYLGNNALEQLNLIDSPSNPSVQSLINQTSTAMGKRLLKERLSHPIKDSKELLRRYSLSKELYDYHQPIEKSLSGIYDIERLLRRIKLNKIHPFEINYLYDSLKYCKEVVEFMENYKFFKPPYSSSELQEFIKNIEESFDLLICTKFTFRDINENFILNGVHSEIDTLNATNEKLSDNLNLIKDTILGLLGTEDGNFVVIKRLEKEGFSLNMTKNRFSNIKDSFANAHLVIDDEVILFKDFNIKTNINSVKISGQIIDTISDKYVHNLNKIIELNKIIFREKILVYEKKFATIIEEIVKFIAEVDITVSNIKTSKKYNYSCPTIIKTKDDENFLELIELRHPIIENQENNGHSNIYVPNDIILGELTHAKKEHKKNSVIIKNSRPTSLQSNPMHGILLYGINSAGKSSLMKSIGISVLLAQSGFFVPARSMRFTIFDSIFTRIIGNDNIKRGLSSFAVEMLELKNIFNRANKRSLVLGDEISHSTETLSGVSIVASAIMKLSKLESLFIFATHLHQITELPEIEKLSNIIPLHLSVMYQDEDDKLIFDRKLKYGRGSSMYGLEFARSLHIDDEFLKNANNIRKRLADDYEPIERLSQKNTSKYNKNLYQITCTICGAKVEEVHHIQAQNKADSNGYIGHTNQNHKFNLIPLCAKHHKAVHSGKLNINGFVTTSKGIELHYTNVEEE